MTELRVQGIRIKVGAMSAAEAAHLAAQVSDNVAQALAAHPIHASKEAMRIQIDGRSGESIEDLAARVTTAILRQMNG